MASPDKVVEHGALTARLVGRRQRRSYLERTSLTCTPLFGDQDGFGGLISLVQSPDMATWFAERRAELLRLLRQHGALLVKGFAPHTPHNYSNAADVLGERLEYVNRSTPRVELTSGVYTSTEYPADQSIPLHNENSYAQHWPSKILFHCLVQPGAGGSTPLADSRRVYDAIDPAIRRRFMKHGVMYVRNFGLGVDLDWREAFQVTDRAEVDRYCARAGITAEWHADGHLQTRHVRPAVVKHPDSVEWVWFNQAHLFHVSALPEILATSLLEEFGERGLPRNAYYGDGRSIEPDVLDAIRMAYAQQKRSFVWEAGDLLLLDNLLCAHGRDPFEGPRRIIVAMLDPCREIGGA